MGAREESREAAIEAVKRSSLAQYKNRLYVSKAADAASDVWEPLVREALDYLGDRHFGAEDNCRACVLAKRLREALQ